jgi:hypothetical protein
VNAIGLARAVAGAVTPQAEPDPIPGAPPVSADEALAAVAGWQREGMRLFGLHQIAVALAAEVERLRNEVDDLGRITRERDVAVRDLCRWRSAAQRLTPGGSEFMDPEAVRAYADQKNQRLHRALSRAVIAERELSRLRAALPDIIGCPYHEGGACQRHAWFGCCATRKRMVRLGLLPAPERPATEDDAA